MKKAFVTVILSLTSLTSFADVGDGKVLSCENDQGKFTIHTTAVVGHDQGRLTLGENKTINMLCKPTNETPSNHYVVWTCEELRPGGGRFLVQVDAGGFTGLKIAKVSQQQVYPLDPQILTSITCQN